LDDSTSEAVNLFSLKLPILKILAVDGARNCIMKIDEQTTETVQFVDDKVYKVYFYEDLLKR